VAAATGARLLGETFPARLERGAGLPPLDRLAYLAEHAQAQLAGLRLLVAIDAAAPVSFFAYPGKASTLSPADCRVELVGGDAEDPVEVLEALAAALGAPTDVPVAPQRVPPRPSGTLNAETLAQGIAALLPANTIVVDEANTSGLYLPTCTAGAPRHDWLALTGGSIGIGLPLAVGAALAKPDARVLCLQADGSAMYTPQALWTMARERLDVTTVILANRSYAILNLELMRVGAGAGGAQARDMLDLTRPTLDFVALAQGMGVTASRATNCEELCTQLERSFATRGPSLIEAVLPPLQMPG
jgi:acetolactate synthase-1/2/3 large subunit